MVFSDNLIACLLNILDKNMVRERSKDKEKGRGRDRDRDRDKDKDRDRDRDGRQQKRKWNPLFDGGNKEVDFKDARTLGRFVTERGRILPRKITGLSAQQQRKVTKAIKRARQMSLLPFLSYGS